MCFTPAAHPDETIPHSVLVSSASLFPTASASSSSWTKLLLAASSACFTFGSLMDPPIIVNEPRQFIIGSTPMERYIFFSSINEPKVTSFKFSKVPLPKTFSAPSADSTFPTTGNKARPLIKLLRFIYNYSICCMYLRPVH